MKRLMWISVAPLAVAVSMYATSVAQQPPPPPPNQSANPPATQPGGADLRVRLNDGEPGERGPRGGPGGREGGREGGPGGPPFGRMGNGDRPPRPDGFGGDGPNGGPHDGPRDGPHEGPHGGPDGGPQGGHRPPSVDTMRNYLELVDRYAAMSSDPVKAGVGAVITAADLLRAQGNDAAIKYFEDILADEGHPVVPQINRAIRLQLAELYKASGHADKALEQLKAVMQAKADQPSTGRP